MPKIYGRDLDLNLLRVFAVVAESGSVTEAAQRLYLTQPAVSAALRRLTTAVGAPLFARSGRGLALTSRGERLRAGAAAAPAGAGRRRAGAADVRPGDQRSHAAPRALGLGRALAPAAAAPRAGARGPADARRRHPGPVPHRRRRARRRAGRRRSPSPTSCRRRSGASRCFTAGSPASTTRATRGCARLTEAEYFARDHVIVSYNGDLRGIVEDLFEQDPQDPLLGLQLRQPRRADRRHRDAGDHPRRWWRRRSGRPGRTSRPSRSRFRSRARTPSCSGRPPPTTTSPASSSGPRSGRSRRRSEERA